MCKPIALTFSKKNEDVYEKISNRDKTKYKTSTDYICAAIRVFEELQEVSEVSESKPVDKYEMEFIINNALSRFKAELVDSNLSFNNTSPNNSDSDSLENLEMGLDLDILNCDED